MWTGCGDRSSLGGVGRPCAGPVTPTAGDSSAELWHLRNRADSHPKIPSYEIRSVPRGPGNTWAHGLGFGIGRYRESPTFGIDIACQSIWSHTWQKAANRIEMPGQFPEAGERTIANHFAFSNVVLRSGMTKQLRRFGLQIGLEARSCAWHVEDDDHPEGKVRGQDEAWPERKPTVCTRVRFDDIDVRWSTCVAPGTGFPAVDDPVFLETAAAPASPDFIAPLRDPLTLHDAPGLDPRSGPATRRPGRTGPGLPQKVQTSGVTIMTTTKTTAVSGSPTRR